MRVEPEEGESRPGERPADDDEFARARNVGKEQVGGEVGAPHDVGEDPERRSDEDGRKNRQTVETVRQIHGVARAHDHDEGEDQKTEEPEGKRNVLEERDEKMKVLGDF